MNLVGNRQDAEELLQDTFLALLDVKIPIASVEAWLYTVARHRSLNRLRSRRTIVPLEAAVDWWHQTRTFQGTLLAASWRWRERSRACRPNWVTSIACALLAMVTTRSAADWLCP